MIGFGGGEILILHRLMVGIGDETVPPDGYDGKLAHEDLTSSGP
jgi:hypothetical protein